MSEQWYWCREHNAVEQGAGCPEIYRLGPYATREEAAHHADRTDARDEAWAQDDREWEQRGASDTWRQWD